MEKALKELSASTLKSLLNTEVRIFIAALDNESTEDLERMKHRLKIISDLITEKEKADVIPFALGKDPTKSSSNSYLDTAGELASDVQTA